jgi:hypothetical protein
MRNKTLFLSAAGLVIIIAMIMAGCSTKNPWGANPSRPLTLAFVSVPADTVNFTPQITYSWTSKGGVGLPSYRYSFNGEALSPATNITSVTLHGLIGDTTYTMRVEATDEGNNTVVANDTFFMMIQPPAPPPDNAPPFLAITEAPEEGSFVATGMTIFFSWDGFDSTYADTLGNRYPGSGADLLFQYYFAGTISSWLPARTVTFANVQPLSHALFWVVARDTSGNISDTASVTFTIKNASVLYIDNFKWLDPFRNPDNVKERQQHAFYHELLNGFAFADWGEVTDRGLPTISDLAGITTIVWAADANVCSADPTFMLYNDVGADTAYPGHPAGGVLGEFLEGGGHLLITGNQALNYIYDTNPPASNHFEAIYMGISDTVIIDPDSGDPLPTWDFNNLDFTWAVKETGAVGYPDSMKIDVGKNGDQLACASFLLVVKDGVTSILKIGLDVDNAEATGYGLPCGWLYATGGRTVSASLMFDTFSMPGPGMVQTFRTILGEFGEITTF